MNSTWISAQLYSVFLQYMPVVCVDIVIPYDNKYLLVKRGCEPAKGEWWLVGGRLLKMEDPQVAVCRKITEELGIVGKCGRFITVESTKFLTGPRGIPVHSINLVYAATITWDLKDIVLGEHEVDVGLFGADDKLPQYVKKCISMYEVLHGIKQ